MFSFKYNLSNTEVGLDPNEVVNVRYRLFLRAIRINGLQQDRYTPTTSLNKARERDRREDRSFYKC